MTSRPPSALPWIAVAGAAVIAGAAGFGLARLSQNPAGPASAAAAPEGAEASAITVAAASLAVMQIAVEPVAAGDLASEIQAPATVTPEPGGEAVVTAQAAGAVVGIERRLGDAVKAGEVLARVAGREAATMAADRSVAEAKLALAEANLARERQLYDERVSPRQDLQGAEAAAAEAHAEARRALAAAGTARLADDGRSLLIVSPIAGRITAQGAALGAYVEAQTELFRVADPRRVQVQAAVSAADAARIHPGDPARIAGSGGAAFANVRSVTPTLSAETRSATVVLTLAPGSAGLTPGEAVQVQIAPGSGRPSGIVIPEEAVQTVNGRDVVFVRTATGFKVQTVTVGSRSGGRAGILSGLKPGQAIATRNAFLLKAELTKGAGDDDE